MNEDEQRRKALEFEFSLFPSVLGAATGHFLDALDRDIRTKHDELTRSEKTDEEKAKEFIEYRLEATKNAHILIRQHSTMICGGLTRDMFPDLQPPAPPEPPPPESIPLEVVSEPVVIGVSGLPCTTVVGS